MAIIAYVGATREDPDRLPSVLAVLRTGISTQDDITVTRGASRRLHSLKET